MDRENLSPSTGVEKLDARIRRARGAQDGRTSESPTPVGLGWAMRLTTEMFAALVVGGGLGWLVDEWLGTRPWLMLVFLLVGCAAGMLNAYRVARRFETGAKS